MEEEREGVMDGRRERDTTEIDSSVESRHNKQGYYGIMEEEREGVMDGRRERGYNRDR